MSSRGRYTLFIGPLQHDEVDIGETLPARCLRHGLWLSHAGANSFAVLKLPFGAVLMTSIVAWTIMAAGQNGKTNWYYRRTPQDRDD